MNLSMRRIFVYATLFALAGCGGATGQSSLAPGASSFIANRLTVPAGASFSVVPRAGVRRAVGPATYPTKKSLLFESDFTNDIVNIYKTSELAKNPSPIATITEPSGGCPYDLALDKKKTLYLADSCLNQIEEYPKGSTTVSKTITNGISSPLGVAIDKNQTLYVSVVPSEIQEYAAGSTTPTKTVTGGGMSEPFGLSLDSSGNLYIADFGAEAVFELPAGGSSVQNLGLQDLVEPLQTAVDQKTGFLWVTDGDGDKVNVYKPGSTSPAKSIAGIRFPYSVTVQNVGRPDGMAAYGDGSLDAVFLFKPGKYNSFAELTTTGDPTGLLLSKP
jgi:hypothetical protein